MKVNVEKTEGIWLGRNRNSNKTPLDIKWPNEPVKVLGIYLSYNTELACQKNFEVRLDKLLRQLHWWKARDLTLIGKILIVKSLGLSQFTYAATVLHIPDHIQKKVNEYLYKFIWDNKPDKVKRNIMIQNYDNGGLKMIDLDMCIKSIHVKWIKEYLSCKSNPVWKSTFEFLSKKKNLAIFCLSNYNIDELPHNLPNYYRDSFKYWKYFKYENVDSKEDLNNQFIWYNKNIEVENKTIYSDNLFKCGMWNVNDLYENGNLVPYNTWIARGAKRYEYLKWRSIIDSIPCKWKNMLKENLETSKYIGNGLIKVNNVITDIFRVTQKQLKDYIRVTILEAMKESDFKARCKYNNIFHINKNSWKEIYMMPFTTLFDNKIIEMQFKVINRTINTNHMLYKMNKVSSMRCEFCLLYNETLEHLLYECLIVKNFWFRVFEKVQPLSHLKIRISCVNIMLAYTSEDKCVQNMVNIIILYGKKYILRCKNNRENLSIESFCIFLKQKLDTLPQIEEAYKIGYNFTEK